MSIISFLKNGHAVHLYTYGDVHNVPDGALRMDGKAVLPENATRCPMHGGRGAGGWTFFSNLFRYQLLHDYGGLWCDTDIVCLRPLEFAAERMRFFATERVNRAGKVNVPFKVATCAMQAQAGDVLMRECYERAIKLDGDTVKWSAAGPGLVTALVNERQLTHELLTPDVFCPVDWWNVPVLIQGSQPVSGDAYAIHFWNEMWRRNCFDKNASYDPLSLYERLKARYLDGEA